NIEQILKYLNIVKSRINCHPAFLVLEETAVALVAHDLHQKEVEAGPNYSEENKRPLDHNKSC
uniref:Uncharacterized protein n=1 Tax=Romanomermis culicivorax TaxID=13658 RepID=A0A915IUK8_ROMCU